MKDFFRTRTFIAMCIIAVLLLGMAAVSAADSEHVTVFEDFAGLVLTPLQNIASTISSKSGDFVAIFSEHDALKAENETLKNKLASVYQALRDAEEARLENESLKGILGIKEQNPDFQFEDALIIANEQSGYSHTLTLNKGSVNGIKMRDLVITSDGVVGYVSKLGSTYCNVTTLLDSSCEIGVLITRTQDIGVLEGDFSLAEKGNCKVSYLSNEVQLSSGDSVVTSGIGGNFPSGILAGYVVEIKPESHGISQYAVMETAVDFSELKNVFVITGFAADTQQQTTEDNTEAEK